MKAQAYIVHRAMSEPSLEWRKPKDCLSAEPLYTKREWVGLTEADIYGEGRNHEKFAKDGSEWFDRGSFARAIEAKLRGKNT